MDKRLYVLVLFGIFMMTVFGVTGCKKIYQTTEIVKELKEYKLDSEEDMTEVMFNGKTLDDWSTILYVKNKEGKGISMYLDITHCCIYFKEKKYFLEKKDAEYLYSLYWQIIPGPDYL